MSAGSLTEKEILERLLDNDIRNIAWVTTPGGRHRLADVVADCAVRWIQAKDFGNKRLMRRAEGSLRLVAKEWRQS